MKQAGTNNPVFMLDEVDKVGMDFRGDPSAALLEVLDPEQNNSFTDHYLGVPFDLTDVMFITTANLIDPILPALRDRMEVIGIPGYTEEEKLGIAQKYLIPRQLNEHGITEKHVRIAEPAVRQIITNYTREAGVRNLEREIANVMRKVAKKVAEGKGVGFPVNPANLHKYLGVPKFVPEEELTMDEIGVATGISLDGVRRRRALHRSHGDEGQGAIDPHRPAGGRDEGIRASSLELRPVARTYPRHQSRCVHHAGSPYPRAGRSDSQRWAVSGHYHGHRHCLDVVTNPGTP